MSGHNEHRGSNPNLYKTVVITLPELQVTEPDTGFYDTRKPRAYKEYNRVLDVMHY